MTVTTAMLWLAALAALIFLVGALTNVSAEVAPFVIVPIGALGLWLAARAGAAKW